tara:strand:- start:227 stop:376 length:150 start_codon:yes stop_codon:yes gene_type:complete
MSYEDIDWHSDYHSELFSPAENPDWDADEEQAMQIAHYEETTGKKWGED